MEANEILKKYWGYEQFRSPQEKIIASILSKQDTIVLLPTGGGKSICYQVPALMQEGLCLVISPLIALMKDQIDQLNKRNIPAAAVFSGMSFAESESILSRAAFGKLKLLYVSPERLQNDTFVAWLSDISLSFIAVDEAHCISQWGHDFRPAYLAIGNIRQQFPQTPFMALTATAPPSVLSDIIQHLHFTQYTLFQSSFVRKNLSYAVFSIENKMQKLFEILKNVPGSSVVYVRSRFKTQKIAEILQQNGFSADFYHAGLSNAVRTQKQEAWIEGRIKTIVSTNAFGMGIDKANVRTVVHLDLPSSIEEYYQEAGRAGRDGKKAYAVLLCNDNDRQQLQEKTTHQFPDIALLRKVYQALGNFLQIPYGSGENTSYDFDLHRFSQQYDFKPTICLKALKLLEQSGYITLNDAAKIPSRFMFTADRYQLYDFQLRVPQYANFIKTMLRSYGGILDYFVPINEGVLGNYLKISLAQVVQMLQFLAKQNLGHYLPHKEQPQIFFVTARVSEQNLLLAREKIAQLKLSEQEKIYSILAYSLNDSVCRTIQLVQYFGEKNNTPCHICDVCVARHQTALSSTEYKNVYAQVMQILDKENLSLQELSLKINHPHKNKVVLLLRQLLENGDLVQHASGKIGRR
ncbi:MAG: ATP-dependent DNA helicase RecQ [Chitinophagales bacterium]|nr:RecQ family ATP-dependent DNA helicase [Bacteroidota bacterium]